MKKALAVLLLMAFVGLTIGLALAADKDRVYYVCNCKDDCKCSSISREPGKCKCGTEMTAMHLLTINKDTALFCRCGGQCTCELSKDDPGKCGCGKPAKNVSLKGKYICACTDGCQCSTISDSPGKCACGKELKQI